MPKFHYYPETDSLYIELSEQPSVESRAIKSGIVLDFDEEGRLVGIGLDHASRSINLSKIEMDSMPLRTLAFA